MGLTDSTQYRKLSCAPIPGEIGLNLKDFWMNTLPHLPICDNEDHSSQENMSFPGISRKSRIHLFILHVLVFICKPLIVQL